MTSSRPDSAPTRRFRRILFAILSTAVTVGILGYLFRFVSVEQVIDVIVNMDGAGLTGFIALSLAMSACRTWRYLVMLRLSGFRPGRAALFLVVVVRNFFSDMLPARIGTLVYVYLVTNRLGIPFGAAASSFALAFVFDMLALAPLLLAAIVLAGAGGSLDPVVLAAAAALLFAISVGVLMALPTLARTAARVTRATTVLPERLRSSWSRAFDDTCDDLGRIRRAGVYGRLLGISLLVRLAKYGSLYMLLYAMVEPLGYGFADLPPPEVLLGLVAPELAASLPISGLAGFGAYEGAWALVFGLLVFPQELATLTAISHHVFTQAYGASLGLSALAILMLPLIRWSPQRSASAPGEAGKL